MHPAPKRFLFIALLASDSDIRLTPHLVRALLRHPTTCPDSFQNNQFFISHYHHADDGLPNLEEYRGLDDDQASMSSVVRPPSSMTLAPLKAVAKAPLFPQDVSRCAHLLRC